MLDAPGWCCWVGRWARRMTGPPPTTASLAWPAPAPAARGRFVAQNGTAFSRWAGAGIAALPTINPPPRRPFAPAPRAQRASSVLRGLDWCVRSGRTNPAPHAFLELRKTWPDGSGSDPGLAGRRLAFPHVDDVEP